MENFWDFVGVAGINALVVGAISFFGRESFKSYLRREEAQDLENHKNALQKTIEELKGEINRNTETYKIITGKSLDREIRYNEKEYKALSECWESFAKAFNVAKSSSVGLYATHNLDSMKPEIIDDYLVTLGLSPEQITLLKNSNDKTDYLQTALYMNEVNHIRVFSDKFKETLSIHQIFLSAEVLSEFFYFQEIIENCWKYQMIIYIDERRNRNANAVKLDQNIEKAYEVQSHEVSKRKDSFMDKIKLLLGSRKN